MPPAKKTGGGDADILTEVEAALELKAKPPPLPRPPSLQNSIPLVDIPCIYLNDRSCWPTIVYKGTVELY